MKFLLAILLLVLISFVLGRYFGQFEPILGQSSSQVDITKPKSENDQPVDQLLLSQHLKLKADYAWLVKAPRADSWLLVLGITVTADRACSQLQTSGCQFDPGQLEMRLHSSKLLPESYPSFYIPGLQPRKLTSYRLAGSDRLSGQLYYSLTQEQLTGFRLYQAGKSEQYLAVTAQPYTPELVKRNLTTTPQPFPTLVN